MAFKRLKPLFKITLITGRSLSEFLFLVSLQKLKKFDHSAYSNPDTNRLEVKKGSSLKVSKVSSLLTFPYFFTRSNVSSLLYDGRNARGRSPSTNVLLLKENATKRKNSVLLQHIHTSAGAEETPQIRVLKGQTP